MAKPRVDDDADMDNEGADKPEHPEDPGGPRVAYLEKLEKQLQAAQDGPEGKEMLEKVQKELAAARVERHSKWGPERVQNRAKLRLDEAKARHAKAMALGEELEKEQADLDARKQKHQEQLAALEDKLKAADEEFKQAHALPAASAREGGGNDPILCTTQQMVDVIEARIPNGAHDAAWQDIKGKIIAGAACVAEPGIRGAPPIGHQPPGTEDACAKLAKEAQTARDATPSRYAPY